MTSGLAVVTCLKPICQRRDKVISESRLLGNEHPDEIFCLSPDFRVIKGGGSSGFRVSERRAPAWVIISETLGIVYSRTGMV